VLHRNVHVDKFVEAKRTKDEDIIGDVHSLSAGAMIAAAAEHDDLVLPCDCTRVIAYCLQLSYGILVRQV